MVVAIGALAWLFATIQSRGVSRRDDPPSDAKPRMDDVRASSPEHAMLRGYVRWPEGQPVDGATVVLQARDDRTDRIPRQEATTDLDGFFRIADVWPATYDVDAVCWIPHATGCAHLGPIDSHVFEIQLTLIRLAPIRGLVLDARERPMGGVEVAVISADAVPPCASDHASGVSDSTGRFEVWVAAGSRVDLEAARLLGDGDLLERAGPLGWRTAVLAGGEDVVVYMPDVR